MGVQDKCSLFKIASDGASCGQTDLNCAYTLDAKAAEKGQNGTCVSQGFSIEAKVDVKKDPLFGYIVERTFSKGLEVQDKCSLFKIASDGASCGQTDLNC